MKSYFLLILLVFGSISQSHANLPELFFQFSGLKSFSHSIRNFDLFVFDDQYRIGDEWGKKPVSPQELEQATPAFRRAVLATARTGGATGFYLGYFNGYHVMATNHHVFPTERGCKMAQIKFRGLDLEFNCAKFFGTWTDIDLSLFAINVTTPEQAEKLLNVAGNFKFTSEISDGQPLITVGFGRGDNPSRELRANQDSDCKVFSKTGDYRFMPDPDALNPGPYLAWSFANGCDVSHGDSGSAMVDRATGDVLGIIWTGKIPKNQKVQNSAYLEAMKSQESEEIWTELSYAVPASKIGEILTQQAARPDLDADIRATFEAMLSH